MRRKIIALGATIVVTLSAGLVTLVRDSAGDWTHGYPPCATEDSYGPCYWDASGKGAYVTLADGTTVRRTKPARSFVVTPNQEVIYR